MVAKFTKAFLFLENMGAGTAIVCELWVIHLPYHITSFQHKCMIYASAIAIVSLIASWFLIPVSLIMSRYAFFDEIQLKMIKKWQWLSVLATAVGTIMIPFTGGVFSVGR